MIERDALKTLGPPLSEGRDEAENLARLIAGQMGQYGIPHAVSCGW
jgi:hypothetical protein